MSLSAGFCWLLMTIVNCSVVQAMPVGEMPHDAPPASLSHTDHQHDAGSMAMDMDMDHDQMACCDSATPVCCEQVAPGLPSKFDDSYDDPSSNLAVQATTQALPPVSLAPTVPGPPDWRLQASPPSLHLLHCSFLD